MGKIPRLSQGRFTHIRRFIILGSKVLYTQNELPVSEIMKYTHNADIILKAPRINVHTSVTLT